MIKYNNPHPAQVEIDAVAKAESSNKKFKNKTMTTKELREKFPEALQRASERMKVDPKHVRDWGVVVYADDTVDIYGWR